MDLAMHETQLDQLAAYIDELELFNPVYKLVGSQNEQLVIRHILDSLSAVKDIRTICETMNNCSIADLGSGAGLPGIPLAIAIEECEFSLVERMGRRVDFLRNALVRTKLNERVTIIDCDLKEVKQTFDIITFRAFRPLVEVLDTVSSLLNEGGVVCAYKAGIEQVEAELNEVALHCKSKWRSEHVKLNVPFLDAQRSLCLLKKI